MARTYSLKVCRSFCWLRTRRIGCTLRRSRPAFRHLPAGRGLQKGVLCVALDVLGYNPETGGGVNWRIRGGIDQATAEDDRQIVRENQSSSPRTKRDVKNEDRSDYVYENIRKMTKCTLLNSAFYTKIHRLRDNRRKSFGLIGRKCENDPIFRVEVVWNYKAEPQRHYAGLKSGIAGLEP